jgi:HSP20 family protein
MFDLVPWEKTKTLSRLKKDMDDLWSRFFGDVGLPAFGSGMGGPAVDVKETKENIIVTAEIPGMNAKDVEVAISGDTLTIKGEKKQEKEEKDESYHLIERRYGAFSRSIRLAAEVDTKNIKANYKDGILTVTLPKTETAKEKQIKIKVE